ncbi:GAP family protein [Mycobacterium sp. 050134]|uniref:GAP family protein n=1 Tax=Mycobacterium sp. 050134 TaxID=3096111 RepID=UPI002EDAC2F8
MWSPALVLALALALDPLRLGLIVLMITRPRPTQSLFAYWVGAMAVSVPYMLVPLMVLHSVPTFRTTAHHLAVASFTSPTVHHIQIAIGVLAISIAALMTIRHRMSPRVYVPAANGTGSPGGPDAGTSASVRTAEGEPDARKERHPVGHVLRGRARVAWDNGSSWISVVVGLASGPPPLTVLLVLTSIMASGTAIGTQVGLAIAWVVGMFAVVEIILVSHVAAPAKTEAFLRRVHDWVLAHRRQTLIALVAVLGIMMVAYGMGPVQTGA